MDPKQDQAFKRLLKKLSALRATLKSDERALLDGLITGAADEVGAHSMNVKAVNTAKNLAKHASPDEAKGLSMNVKAINTAKNLAKHASPDEAKGLSMNVKAINTAKNLAKHASPDETKALSMDDQPAIVSVRVIYDPTQDEYRTV